MSGFSSKKVGAYDFNLYYSSTGIFIKDNIS